MKYKFLRISLLSALAVLFGGTALGAFMAAAEEAADDAGSGGSETVTYAMQENETHNAGETVEVKNGDDVVATLTFGFEGGAEFKAGKADSKLKDNGFVAFTEGNGENGKPESGTVYIITPKYDGSIEAGVVLNADKEFYVLEDGTALEQYDGIKVEEKYYGVYEFDVKGGSEYKVYCGGSKLGFYGFNYTYIPSAAGEDPEDEEPQEGDGPAIVKMTYVDYDNADTAMGEVEQAQAGYNKIANGEVGFVNTTWGENKIAYLQVDASEYPGTITSATLTFEASGSTDSKRTTGWGVGYNSSVWSADMTYNTADKSITTIGGEQWTATKSATVFETFKFDITEALKNAEDKVATILVYETAAAGGYVKNPVVTVSYTTAKIYAVTFAETNGVEATVTVNGSDVTNGTSLPKGEYEFTATAAGYKDYTGSFTVEGADKVVEFTMTEKAIYNYTVKGVGSDGTDFGVVSKGTGYEEENVTYYYPEFVLSGTTLYKKNQNGGNPYWGATGALDTDNKEFTVTYGDGTVENVIFYKEAEEMEGFTAKTTNNATIRCSNGTGGIVADTVKLVTVTAGKYKIFGQVWGTTGLTVGVKTADADVWTLESTGSLASGTSEEFELTETTELYVYTYGGNDNHMLDLIYIISEDGAVVDTEEPGVDESTWEKVGTAILEDPWVLPGLGEDQHLDENKWEVPLERNTENENLYRLVDPYHAEGPVKAYNESDEVGYIVFDVTDPDHVVFSITNAGFANSTTVKPKVNVFYAYNQISKYIAYGYTIADVVETFGDDFPYTTFKDGVVTLGEGDACYGEQSDMLGGFDWENGAEMTGTITLKIDGAGDEATTRRWDFTKWSDATVANLIADAAQGVTEGWSDVEKNGDTEPTETSKDNCFWSVNTPDEIGGLSANNVLIDELKGLKFGANVNNRGLAIAVNYPVALSTYEGGAYLWLGGANKKFFTIPAVKGGSTIKMGVESHKTTDARGVDLLVNGESIGQFTPTVYEEYTWTIAEGEAVDVVVDNTNGCHIYFIEVEQDQEALLAVATEDLKTVIAAAEAIEDLSIYTEESVTAFNAALTAAKAAEGTIEAQTEAAYALIDAKAALQKAEPDPDPVMMTYTVKEVAGDVVFRTTEGEALEGTDVKVAYRLYNADENGKLYKKGATSKEYNYSFKLTEEGQEEAIEYDATDVENVIFLAEGEDIEGLTPITTGNAAIRSSNSAAGHAAEDTEIVVLTAGTYTVHVVMYDAAKGGGEEFTFKAGEQENTLTAGENISESEFDLTLAESTPVVLVANTATNKGLDAIYITSTDGEVITGISTINAEAGNGAIYNLQGQKVQKAQKGLYIINGKKVVVK